MATPKKSTRSTGTKKSAPKTTAAKKAPAKKAPAKKPPRPKLAVRNLTNCQYAFRTDDMQDAKRRIELKPRGERGDLHKLQPGQENDREIKDGLMYGILELITHAEADAVHEKQTYNRQPHPALAMLRNEYGEEYEDGAVYSTPSFEDQGVVVAQLAPVEGSEYGEVVFDRGGIRRTLPEPGEQVQQGPRRVGERRQDPLVTQQPGRRRNNTRVRGKQPPVQVPRGQENAAATDAKARLKGLGGIGAGLPDGAVVTVGPTQKT